MKKIFLAALLFACSCSVMQKEESVESAKPKFFVSAPIAQLNTFECPCINIEIEGRTYLLQLDLGFRGALALQEEAVNGISSKTFIREGITYGIRSKEYKKKVYQIPEMNIASMTFSPPTIQEENGEFLKDAEFWKNEDHLSVREEVGRLGCSLFQTTNLLIDIQNSQIAFCDSIDTLRENGYATQTFVKTPLFLENGLVEFEANTPNGPLRCILDTGSTWNVLNAELESEKPIDVAVWEPENILEYPSFHIEGTDFGPTHFHRMPIQIPLKIEAILGMEFCEDNLIFLDFCEKQGYFLKREPN